MKLSPLAAEQLQIPFPWHGNHVLPVYEVTDEMSKYCISWIGGEDKKWVKYEENKSGSPDL